MEALDQAAVGWGTDKRALYVDFDGVIHEHRSPWTTPAEIHDGPVAGAIEWLNAACERFDVVVFSARASDPEGREAIVRWLHAHGVSRPLLVTHQKSGAVVYLDDRAWRFEGSFPSLDEIDAFVPWNRREKDDDKPAADVDRAALVRLRALAQKHPGVVAELRSRGADDRALAERYRGLAERATGSTNSEVRRVYVQDAERWEASAAFVEGLIALISPVASHPSTMAPTKGGE